jgi:hypothetical protein
MQFSDLRTRLRKRCGNPSTTDVADSDLNEHINDAYVEIANKYRFRAILKRQSISTVAGTRSYDLTAGYHTVKKVWSETTGKEKRLTKIDDRQWSERTALTIQGEPTGYHLFVGKIEFDPLPDGIYTIVVQARADITALSADSDVPVIPVTWHEGILMLAKYKYYSNQQGDLPKAYAAKNEYKDWLSDQPDEVDEEKMDIDSGVSIPTLGDALTSRLDFDHSP